MKHPNYPNHLLYAVILLACCLSSIRAQEQPEMKWPEGALERIEALLTIKKEAMRIPRMRSIEGEFGRRAEAVMDQITPLVSDPDFLMSLRNIETRDIRAKIALWAVDRKRRPEEYARFARWYVNSPNPLGDKYQNPFLPKSNVSKPKDGTEPLDEWTEYFYRPHREEVRPDYLPKREPWSYRPRSWGKARPNPVDEGDMSEANRWIMEYCYFVPPAGLAFGTDIYRPQLAYALLKTPSSEKSLIVFLEDGKLQTFDVVIIEPGPYIWLWVGTSDRSGPNDNAEAYWYLTNLPIADSFRALAILSKDQRRSEYVRESFIRVWKDGPHNWIWDSVHLFSWQREDRLEHHAKWMELANQNWQEPHEKELSRWLQTTRVEESPPDPNPPPPPFGPGKN